MDSNLLRERITRALDEAAELESRQYEEKMVKEGKAEEAAELERKERTIRALERIAQSFDRIAESFYHWSQRAR